MSARFRINRGPVPVCGAAVRPDLPLPSRCSADPELLPLAGRRGKLSELQCLTSPLFAPQGSAAR